MNPDFINLTHEKPIMRGYLKTKAIFHDLLVNRYLKLMLIFALVYLEALLIGLVRDAVFNFWPKHYLIALHEVTHNII